ncbi:zinc-binding dehydrogenase [Streptomyces sp. NPDC001276]|uniref:zinc-binding dehydrogenase n=1 Tax=Streptomyces sp. NPDC001276 TaxID=3364555 RepID=UPI00369C4874
MPPSCASGSRTCRSCRQSIRAGPTKAAGGRPVSVAFDPIGGELAESLLDLLTPGGKLVSYGLTAEEPISVHASTLLNKSLTLRGKNIGRWLSEASTERRASDVATAKQIALGLKDQFDVAPRTALANWPTPWSTRYGPARSASSSSAPDSRRKAWWPRVGDLQRMAMSRSSANCRGARRRHGPQQRPPHHPRPGRAPRFRCPAAGPRRRRLHAPATPGMLAAIRIATEVRGP